MRACGCGEPIHKYSKSGLCKSCAATRRYMDPAARAKQSEAKKRALQDPEKRARVVAGAMRTLEAIHARGGHKIKPKMPGRGFLYRVPPERRDEFRHMSKVQKLGAAEAFRIIDEDERQKVRRKTLALERQGGA